ncbi:DUF2634 domain-containing protein [Paenibacillus bovis]|uniref:DUF2634 domain-containing protein n=1 Tax=Paenibacillus bovis TaxID=1616788 RepID=A0A172ZFQ4_9BACL|nr:DUF2634 domain-containing protein [Paenibacillus bovis]ANF95980.1 hypothetical protein AR543_08150 [Paenibacillus bovis]
MANLFPDTDDFIWGDEQTAADADSTEVIFGRSWRYDYDAGDFVMTPSGRVAVADEKEAWVQWCHKAILTPRYRHVIYSRDYGSELEELIGSALGRAVMESEITRMVSEALLMDERTASVDQFTFTWSEDHCMMSCRITNVQDDTEILESEVI